MLGGPPDRDRPGRSPLGGRTPRHDEGTTLHRVDLLDSYTGHVEPGGPAAQRDLQDVSITKVSVGPMDLEHKVFSRLDDDTHVYPGHGDDTTLGTERPHLPEWRERGW